MNVAPGIQAIIAPNPGPMTYWGTNTYILGDRDVAIVDPGPDDPRHHAAISQALGGRKVSHILVTHAHLDHSPLAARLGAEWKAPVVGFGPHDAGRQPVMQRLAKQGHLGGGEGVDTAFAPEFERREGDRIEGSDWFLEVMHTPGHFAGHLAFGFGDILFSGDHAMDWSSSLVSPPDGDLRLYMETTERLIKLGPGTLLTGHGGPIDDPVDRLTWLLNHRKSREAQIIDALSTLPQTLMEITQRVYLDVPEAVLASAARNAFAHLIDLCERRICHAIPDIGIHAQFTRGPHF